MEKKNNNTIKVILTEEEKQILERASEIIRDLTFGKYGELFILDDDGECAFYDSKYTYNASIFVDNLANAEEVFTLKKK